MNVFEKEESLSSEQRRSCCSLPGLPHHPGKICLAAGSLFSRDEWLSRFLRPDPPPWWGRRGSGMFSTSRECSPSVTPTPYPRPFRPLFLFHAALVAVAPLVLGPGRLPSGQGLDFSGSPVPVSPLVATVAPAVPYCLPHDAPSFVSRRVPNASPRPGLLVGLIRARARCSPRGTSCGRSVQPRPPYFRRGRRTDLSPRERVPPIPEGPGRALTPDSSKRLHIHAVPSSSTPARPFLDTSLEDPHASLRAACPVSGARRLVLYPTLW